MPGTDALSDSIARLPQASTLAGRVDTLFFNLSSG
jgi:hypothetical protein